MRANWILAVLLVVGVCGVAMGEARLTGLISNHMVVQAGREVPVWGYAESGEKVVVSIGENRAETVADEKGKWSVKLPAMEASDKPVEMLVEGKNKLVVKDILVGEVWFCAGQSNMGWPLDRSKDGVEVAKKADHPGLRIFVRASAKAGDMPEEMHGSWQACTPKLAARFSAVAYYFGRHLQEGLKRPVGLIEQGVGGSYIEEWISRETFETDPTLADFAKAIESDKAAAEKLRAEFQERMKKWQATTQAIVTTRPELARARSGEGLPYAPKRWLEPEAFYSRLAGSVWKLRRVPLAGVIWYQGESQLGAADAHRRSFPALIKSWRKDFGREDLPLLFVQMPNNNVLVRDPNERALWAELRESQDAALALPHTLMVATLDVGEAHNVHPGNKQPVGERLAIGAMGMVYGRKDAVPYASPVLESMQVEGAKVILKFRHAEGGLVTRPEGKPVGFAIAGADGKYVWADATIEGETVVLESDRVKSPVSVRHGWANNPVVNVFNKNGFPLGTFRAGEKAGEARELVSPWQRYLRN